MRIARIIEYFPPHIGGMERHGLILSQEQVKLGHDVEIFIGVGNPSLFKKTFRAPLQFLPLYSKLRRILFNFWAYNKIKKIHKKNPYNVIHLHGDFVEAYFGSQLSKKLNIPAILTIHAGLNQKWLLPKNKRYFDGIKKIICVSQTIVDDLKNINIEEDKIKVISSGIYLDDFKNNNGEIEYLRGKYSKPIIVSVGVLRINKGFKYLIDAFKKVLNIFPSATLLIVGDGPEKDNLLEQTKEIKSIKFLDGKDYKKVIKYLKAANIFALASVSTKSDREGTPTTIMEAMAAGLPVVATKVGGNPYLIKNGENGILVEERNSEIVAEAIISLWNSESLRKQIKEKNLEAMKQKDWPIIAKKITAIYYENINNNPGF